MISINHHQLKQTKVKIIEVNRNRLARLVGTCWTGMKEPVGRLVGTD